MSQPVSVVPTGPGGDDLRFPLLLNLAGRRVLVVGAGPIGTRRALALLQFGANVDVVAPIASPTIQSLATSQDLCWSQREFRDSDVERAWLVVAATGIVAIDERVAQLCELDRTWCVSASKATMGSAATPAIAHGPDGVVVAVSGGGDPGRAQAIRDAIDIQLSSGSLPLRRRRPTTVGRVTLVGAGPGDPTLITVRGKQAIAQADVVVVDRLAAPSLWSGLGPEVEIIDVGKTPGHHAVAQHAINDILVTRAQAGNNVVRIKGGDSFVLGRGGEEALACVEAGIRVEIVPGITSAIAVPAAAGIPVTHRSITSSFVVASAHDGPKGVLAAIATAPPIATLVLLMGAGRLQEIAVALVGVGRSTTTPLAIIQSGWTPQQHTTVTTLGQVADSGVNVTPPAVVVVGDVVGVRAVLGDLARPAPGSGHAPG